MNIQETGLPGVRVIEADVHADERGFLIEVFRESPYQKHGIPARYVQVNHTRSRQGVIRGMHYQLRQPQAKLCCVISGAVLDVVVDIRSGSPTFGQYVAVELSAKNHRQIYIPPGLAHGFAVLSETADFLYACDREYAPGDEYGFCWNDPTVTIAWPAGTPMMSERDRLLPRLAEIPVSHLPVFTA